MADAKNPLDGAKTWWRGLSKQNKWLIGGGAGLLVVLAIAAAGSGGPTYQGQAYQGQGYPGQGYQGQGYQGQGYQGQGDQGQGYANQGYPGLTGNGYGQNGGGQAGGDDPTGYWERQRSQEQQSRAFSGYIRDTNTVQDNNTGQVYTDVPNTYADPAIESGGYSQVPTAELPTTTPAPAETPAPAPAE